MKTNKSKKVPQCFAFAPETVAMLAELKIEHDRSKAGVIEQLIKKDFKERGLSHQGVMQ